MEFTYKGLKAQYTRHAVTGEEVDRQLTRLLQQNPRIALITDRPTQLGDEVVLDYAGFCGDEQFAGGTAQNQTLVLGSGMFIPGFEEQLVEEPVTVKVTFPESYHAENLAGKEARFECVIHQIRVKTAYELDDTFAKEVGECDSLEEMRQKMRESMQAFADERGEMDLQDQLLRQAAATLDFSITPEALEQEVDQQMKVMEAQLARQGLSIEMYCQFMSTTVEDLRKDAHSAAEAALRNHAAIERIVELEKIEPTQQELAEALAVIARQNGLTMDQLREYYTPEFEAAVMKSVLTGKVMQLIREHADVTEV